MPKVTLECEMCEYKTKKYVGGWRKHLLEDEHQSRTRERSKTFSAADKERCCVVFGLRGLQRKDVLKFFCEKYVVTDFIFWSERPDFCIVEFFLKSAREQVAAETKSLFGNEVVIRLRNEISDIEWISICPLIKVEVEATYNPAPAESDDDDDDCVVIENPYVEVKKEVVDLDLDVQNRTSIAVPCSSSAHSRPENNVAASTDGNRSVGSRVIPNKQIVENVNPSGHPISESSSQQGFLFRFVPDVTVKSEHPEVPNGEEKADCNGANKMSDELQRGASSSFAQTHNDSISPPHKRPRIERGTNQAVTNTSQGAFNSDEDYPDMVAAAYPPGPSSSSLANSRSKIINKKMPNHTVVLIPKKNFKLEIRRVRDNNFRNAIQNDLPNYWAQLIQEFNSLVWENLFGIELYGTSVEYGLPVHNQNQYTQIGPIIRGTLIFPEKIRSWTKQSTVTKKVAQAIFKEAKLACIASLDRGQELKPFKQFDAKAQELSKRANAILTFELQIVLSKVPKDNPECRLIFRNIIGQSFKKVVQMFSELWNEFCIRRLKGYR